MSTLMVASRPTTPQPKKWDHKGVYVMYSGEGRAAVFLQHGCLFNEQKQDIFYQFATDPDRKVLYRNNILIWLDQNGYSVNAELRSTLVRTLKEQQLQARMDEERRIAREREAQELAEMEAALAAHRRSQQQRGPVQPAAQTKTPTEDLQLTDMEAEVLGSMFSDDEDDETGLPPLSSELDEEDIEAPPEEEPAPARITASKRKR